VKVLEFAEQGFVPSGVAALADWGADVIKVERLTGDPMRSIIANGLVADADGSDYLWELFNRNKRGIALDVEAPAGREVFERLVRWADVYVTNQLPRVRRKLRTEPADLFALNPTLVFAKGHGQGQRGADAEAGGYDSVSYWSRGGVGHMLTPPSADRIVMQRPGQGDIPSGMFLAAGVCAALVGVKNTGEGIVVDTSLLSGAVWTLGPDVAYASITGTDAPQGEPDPVARTPLVGQHRTADGRWLSLGMIDEARYWGPACRALGLDALGERFPDAEARAAHRREILAAIDEAIATRTRAELEPALRANDCIHSFYASPAETLDDPAVVENAYAPAVPGHPTLRLAAAPAQFDDRLPVHDRPAPRLGEHTREILGELGFDDNELAELADAGVVTVGSA
jgi:crotonobetainyl-CoA:carnitine CoA-transferase CaiB-like acyl-CoA transferase